MPELPEVETTCQGIKPYLEGNSICSVEVRDSRLRWPVSEEVFTIKDALIKSVSRRAKYIIIDISIGNLLCHLGMSGSFRLCDSAEELKKHDHLIFHLNSGKELRYNDPRRFGCVLFTENPYSHSLLKDLGPEPLTEEFTAQYFFTKTQCSSAPIKSFIMNNKNVVGVGNIYACEALFLAKISPLAKANSINKNKIKSLTSNIKTTLAAAIKKGGTTLRDFVNHDGQPGYFQQELYVYNQEGQPCKLCQTQILRITQAQRSTFYCPKCQK